MSDLPFQTAFLERVLFSHDIFLSYMRSACVVYNSDALEWGLQAQYPIGPIDPIMQREREQTPALPLLDHHRL